MAKKKSKFQKLIELLVEYGGCINITDDSLYCGSTQVKAVQLLEDLDGKKTFDFCSEDPTETEDWFSVEYTINEYDEIVDYVVNNF